MRVNIQSWIWENIAQKDKDINLWVMNTLYCIWWARNTVIFEDFTFPNIEVSNYSDYLSKTYSTITTKINNNVKRITMESEEVDLTNKHHYQMKDLIWKTENRKTRRQKNHGINHKKGKKKY